MTNKFIAIVRKQNNRIAKYQDYISAEQAREHVNKFGGFVYENLSDYPIDWIWINDDDTITIEDPRDINEYTENALRVIEEEEKVAKKNFEEVDPFLVFEAKQVLASDEAAVLAMDANTVIEEYPILSSFIDVEGSNLWEVSNAFVTKHKENAHKVHKHYKAKNELVKELKDVVKVDDVLKIQKKARFYLR